MNYSLVDSKLKSLIRVCKKTGNYKKLAVVSFILTSNLLDEIGIKLGIRPRDKDSDETIFRYMSLINSILKKNLKILLFKEDIMTTVKEIEIQFIKRKADIPSDYIKEIYDIYYDIRKLDVPNLHETFKNELIELHDEAQLYEFMSPGSHRSAKSTNLALQNIDVEPRDIDILTNKDGALKSNEILKEFLIKRFFEA